MVSRTVGHRRRSRPARAGLVSGRASVRDWALVAGLAALTGLAPFLPGWQLGISIPGRAVGTAQWWWPLVQFAMILPLGLRRARSGQVLVAVSLAFLLRVVTDTGPSVADFAMLVAVDAVAAYGNRRDRLAFAVYALSHLALVVVVPATRAEMTVTTFLSSTVIFAALPLGTGLLRRRTPTAPAAGTPGADVDPSGAPERSPEPAPGHTAACPTPPPRLRTLTPREREVLTELATGATNAEIAARLGISPETAKTHVGRIVGKLGVRDRTAAALLAPPGTTGAGGRSACP